MYYLQSRYYDPEVGRFINADAFASTGQGVIGNNMFAYCNNNAVNCIDPSGTLLIGLFASLLAVSKAVVDIVCMIRTPNAKAKYNYDTVAVYRSGDVVQEKQVNAMIYSPTPSASNISVDKSLEITSKAEQNAVLDVIIDSPYYDKEIYGSKNFMRAQWVAHNLSYNIASSGEAGFRLMQMLSGSDNPLESSASLDLRSLNNMLKRQRIVYEIISWVY